LDPTDYKVLLIVAGLVWYTQFGITIKIKPMAWREFLGGKGTGRCRAPPQGAATWQPARVDKRHEMGTTRGKGAAIVGGACRQEALAWWEAAQQPARQETQEGHDERRRCCEKQRCRNMGGGSMMRGDATKSLGGKEVRAPEKKRGMTGGGNTARGGQVETQPDRWWHDKKLKYQRTRGNTTTSRGRQEAWDRDLAESEVTMAWNVAINN
jgi:hypothetical protein